MASTLASGSGAYATETSVAVAQPPSRWSFDSGLSVSGNLFPVGDVDSQATADMDNILAYKASDKVTVSARLILSQDLTGRDEQTTSVSRTSLSVRHRGVELNPYLRLSPGGSVILPFHRDAIARQSMILGIAGGPRLYWTLEPAGLKGLTGYVDVGLRRNFNTYTTQTTGVSNDQYSLLGTLDVVWAVGAFSLDLTLVRGAYWTYAGNLRNNFDFNQEIAYSISDRWSVAVGHNNAGNALKPDGYQSNVELFNERSSTVYTTLSVSL